MTDTYPVNLYCVQDSDRPMWVVAVSWAEAVEKWQKLIAEENGDDCHNEQPNGIMLVCESDELIL